MSYAADRASAYADILAAGGALVISRTIRGAEASDGTFGADTDTSLNVAAMAKRNDPTRMRDLGLSHANAITLLTAPSTDGVAAMTSAWVMPGDTLPWNNETYTVRDVQCVAPDGTVIVSTLVAER